MRLARLVQEAGGRLCSVKQTQQPAGQRRLRRPGKFRGVENVSADSPAGDIPANIDFDGATNRTADGKGKDSLDSSNSRNGLNSVPEENEIGDALNAPALSIVVPAYNEAERIGGTLKRMLAYFDAQPYTYEILVVSDGSSDATLSVVEPIAAQRSQVRLLSYAGNRGKGYAVRYGILRAQRRAHPVQRRRPVNAH